MQSPSQRIKSASEMVKFALGACANSNCEKHKVAKRKIDFINFEIVDSIIRK
jgi:hypothetical protein